MEYDYFVDGEKVAEDEFYEIFHEQVEVIAKEDGIYYEWLNNNLPNNEYEEWEESTINFFFKLLQENGSYMVGYKVFEIRKA